MLTPYDWNQTVRQRVEFVTEQLREGSPVVGVSFASGLALVTLRRAQRKVFDIYDRVIYAALGNQGDLEAVRLAAVDFAHKEGFTRSPQDVTAQRIVGSALSPAMKAAFGDPFRTPFVVRGLFAELRRRPEDDLFFTLDHDGEFFSDPRRAVVAGTPEAEEAGRAALGETDLAAAAEPEAIAAALQAWGATWATVHTASDENEPGTTPSVSPVAALTAALEESSVEVGVLDRETTRMDGFRLLGAEDLAEVVQRVRES
jgi:proteasome alpha subunit